MKDTTKQSDGIIDHVEELSNTFLKLVFVNIVRKGVELVAGVINSLIIYIAAIFMLFFAAGGLAFWLGDLVNNRAAGFFMVAGLFCLIVFLIILLRKKTIFPFLKNMLVRKIYE